MRTPAAMLSWLILGLAGATPGGAQTVIRDSAPPAPPATTGPGARPDSAARPAGPAGPQAPAAPAPATAPAPTPAPAPAPSPTPQPPPLDPSPKGVCTNAYGGVATDVLLVTFQGRSTPEERDAAIKAVKGTLVAPDPNDDASAYVRVPSDGNEFALRALADRLIRVRIVKEVGPAPCPASP
jgi:hypothetical protein